MRKILWMTVALVMVNGSAFAFSGVIDILKTIDARYDSNIGCKNQVDAQLKNTPTPSGTDSAGVNVYDRLKFCKDYNASQKPDNKDVKQECRGLRELRKNMINECKMNHN